MLDQQQSHSLLFQSLQMLFEIARFQNRHLLRFVLNHREQLLIFLSPLL